MATGLPALSQIHAWDVNHLIEAAEHWHSTAAAGRACTDRCGNKRSAWTGMAEHAML
jgi:hypothetical protein